jgi:hypothetical protein
MADNKSLLGVEVVVTNMEGMEFRGFVAQIDVNIGVTVEPLDKDKFDDYYGGNQHLFCLNKKHSHLDGWLSYDEAYKWVTDKIIKGGWNMEEVNKVLGGGSCGRQVSCAFS